MRLTARWVMKVREHGVMDDSTDEVLPRLYLWPRHTATKDKELHWIYWIWWAFEFKKTPGFLIYRKEHPSAD